MRNEILTLAALFEQFDRALAAEMVLGVERGNALSGKVQRQFQKKVNSLVNDHYQLLGRELTRLAKQIAREARDRAYRDAGRTVPRSGTPRLVLRPVMDSLKLEYLAAGLEAVKQLRRFANHQQMMINAGLHPEAARHRAREGQRKAMAVRTRRDSRGRKVPAGHRFALMVGEYFNQLALDTYLKQAAQWGYTEFVIDQPEHERDGQRFTLDRVPAAEFHPQSEARPKLVKEES